MSRSLPENMADFFDKRVEGYEQHMVANMPDFQKFYRSIAEAIGGSDKPVKVLDIGCGTGLELEGIFEQVPGAAVTCNDISELMLKRLSQKYNSLKKQISILPGSYLEIEFPENYFDYTVSVMTLHHLAEDEKLRLYRRILKSLKPNGKDIEGDFAVDEFGEQEYRQRYESLKPDMTDLAAGTYHVDIPFTVKKQLGLMSEAGFRSVEIIWQKHNAAVFVCCK
jgi:tRNA (cmo5U34)-methyltransferase